MADGSSIVKAGGGMVVQVVRSGGSAPLGGNTISVVDMPTSAQRSYVIPSQQQQPNTEGNTPAKRMTMQGRTLSMTPMHPRFTATNRLGTPQTVPAPSYGIKRPFTSDYGYEYSAIRKFPRSADKSKGLRHFSTKVCEKVKEKGHTNYNEVADELVQEYFDSLSNPPCDQEKQQYDMKNIRRRVYDALNVLMAMNIIVKEKKEISWVGLPTSSIQECRRLEEEKSKRLDRIKQKAEQLQELIIQLVAYKSLVERNREKERNDGRPPENTVLYLPYIVVNTDKKTTVDCHISDDKTEYLFNFDQPFEIHDDIEVLKRLGLAHGLERAEVTAEQRPKVKGYLPPALRDYVDQILEGTLCGGLIGPSVKSAPPVTVINPISIDRKPISLYGSPMIRMPMSTGGTSGIITSGNRSFSRPLHEYASRPANIQTSTMRYTVLPRGAQQIGQQQQQQRYASGTTTFRSVGGTGGRQYLVQPTSTGRPMTYVQQRTQPITYNIQAPQSHHHHQQQQQHHFIEAEQIYDEDDENMVDFE